MSESLSPSPPRFLSATPLPSTTPNATEGSPTPPNVNSRRRQIIHSHFKAVWRQDQVTGVMTLSEPTASNAAGALGGASDDSDEDDRDGDTASNSKADRRALSNWRNKERMRTMGVAIALCLNLGTDPPDSDRVYPCARTQCGIDPTKYHIEAPSHAVLKMIGTQLEEQFRNLQPRAKIKLAADPTVETIRKTCTSLRRLARNERVLVHFNGHGVPRPTRNGEIWAFNEDFTQYIPLSVFDLIRWTGHPAMFTFDCQSAGQLIHHFADHEKDNERKFKQQLDEWRRNRAKRRKEQERRDRRERDNERLVRMARAPNSVLLTSAASTLSSAASIEETRMGGQNSNETEFEEERPVRKRIIVLVPCGMDEALPSSPQLPADLFTSCLTVPIQTALRWFILQNRITMEPLGLEQGIVNLIPGKAGERKTMLGELNWIFTAVTDTIAWSVLPRKLFQRLFRQDLLVASMLRHFLLAERVFRSLGCTPQSIPVLPSTWKHRMWDAWDQAVENFLIQLPGLIPARVLAENGFHRAARVAAERQKSRRIPRTVEEASTFPSDLPHLESRFFRDQLQAFEMWLSQPASASVLRPPPGAISIPPPEQLPVVLQVLLSLQHRVVALDQLARFLDLGPWAVSHALSVGIFPYVLKLLQNPVPALKSFLVRIWVRILDLDPSCRDDLNQAKEQGYFVRQLSNVEESDHVACAALVLCISCKDDPESKMKCLSHDLDRACLALAQDDAEPERDHAQGIRRNGNGRSQGAFRRLGSPSDSEEADSDSEGSDDVRPPVRPPPGRHQQVVSSSPLPGHSPGLSSPLPNEARSPDPDLVRWCCVVLATLWDGFEQARVRALSLKFNRTVERLLIEDESCTVREAAAYALGRLLGPLYVEPPPATPLNPSPPPQTTSHAAATSTAVAPSGASGRSRLAAREEKSKSAETCDAECDLAVRLLKAARQDGSPLVRRELVLAVARFVCDSAHLEKIQLVVHLLSEHRQRSSQTQADLINQLHEMFGPRGPKYMAVWLDLTRVLAVDPFPAVSQTAQILTRFVRSGVDARIEAIKGRAGEFGVSSLGSALPSSSEPSSTLLESNLFDRAKRKMCRTRLEMEEDSFAETTGKTRLERKLAERRRTRDVWATECSRWIVSRLASEWWYEESVLMEEDIVPRSLKTPFLQLLRSQAAADAQAAVSVLHSNAASMGGSGTGAGGGSGEHSRVEDSTGPSDETESDFMRRFDQLPPDIFSTCRATQPLRTSASFFPSVSSGASGINPLLRQSSLSLVSLQRDISLGARSSSSRALADRSPNGTHKMEETHRIELARHGLGGATQQYVAAFHPSSPYLVLAHQQTVSCFDASAANKSGPVLVSRFSNLNIAATSISSITWIDAETDPLLLTYSDDGHVRVWRDAVAPSPLLASAFSPFDLASAGASAVSSSSSAGSTSNGHERRHQAPLAEWVPRASMLICTSAASPAIRVWDLVSERLVSELICTGSPGTTSTPSVLALASTEKSALFGSGFSDGTARIFDQRASGKFNSILVRGNSSAAAEPVVAVSRLSANNCFSMVTESGSVRVWDVRMTRAAVYRTEMRIDGGDCIFAFHPNAPILACSQRKASPPVVRVVALDDSELCLLKSRQPSSGASGAFSFMAGSSRHIKQTCALAWHPQELALVVGSSDILSTFVAPNTRVRGVWSPLDMKSVLAPGSAQSAANQVQGGTSQHSGSNASLV